MLLGLVVTMYELGGWRLLLGIPATAASLAMISRFADGLYAEKFRDDLIHDLSVGCPQVPADVVELLRIAEVCEIETNRVRLEVQTSTRPGSVTKWRVVACGTRENISQPWNVRALQVLCSVEDT